MADPSLPGDLILVLDEGTSSTRALLFGADGAIHGAFGGDGGGADAGAGGVAAPIASRHPHPGWVEQDAEAIWAATLAMAQRAVAAAGGPGRIAGIGLANQRETVVAWDRASGTPLAPAIVWQDRRTAGRCRDLAEAGHEPLVQQRSGLLLDPYFSASKMRWLIDEVPAVAEAAAAGRLALGTIDSWLIFRLTGQHLTDASNASRTALMDLERRCWDETLCDLFGVPMAALGRICDMVGPLGVTRLLGGEIALTGSAGDQQAATIGQGCLAPGSAKATFGTGLFALAATGTQIPVSRHRLLATLLTSVGGEASYALEGSVFVAGSLVKWLRDMAGLVGSAAETEPLARSVPDTHGVTIIPAFSGLGAPHWRAEARGSIQGLSFGVSRAHLVRAALEAVTMSSVDLADAFAADHAPWTRLRIDGGMAANGWLAQDLADMLAIPVERPENIESTARGAAMLAAVGAGLYPDLDAAMAMRPAYQAFVPGAGGSGADAGERLARWRREMARALA